MTFFSAAHAWQKEGGERGKRNGRMGRAIGELFETRGPNSLPRLSLSLVHDTRRCALSAALRVTTQMHGGIMRRRNICTNEQHAARMIYRFTAQGYLILANYVVDNRWRTRRSKEVSFRRIRASSPRSTPNHPDELCDFSSISGVSRLPCDINCAGTNAFSLRRGGGKNWQLHVAGLRLSSGLDSFSFSSLFISRYFSSILRVVDNKFPLSRDNALSPRLDFDEEKSSLTPLLPPPRPCPSWKKGLSRGRVCIVHLSRVVVLRNCS